MWSTCGRTEQIEIVHEFMHNAKVIVSVKITTNKIMLILNAHYAKKVWKKSVKKETKQMHQSTALQVSSSKSSCKLIQKLETIRFKTKRNSINDSKQINKWIVHYILLWSSTSVVCGNILESKKHQKKLVFSLHLETAWRLKTNSPNLWGYPSTSE